MSVSQRRPIAALVCLVAFLCGTVPVGASSGAALDEEALALSLLNSSRCGATVAYQQVQETPQPSPSSSPSPGATPTFVPTRTGITQLYPSPAASAQPVTPPPVPTSTPLAAGPNGPIFLVRGGSTPPPVPPAGTVPAAPTAAPSGAPTLAPGMVAVISDQVVGNVKQGEPGDAIGNVHIYYTTGELVGDRAHYDGLRTVTVTGHPFLVNRARDSVLQGDSIVFDTIDQTASLSGGVGTSNEGVERGLVHFASKDLHTDPSGIGHGTDAVVSTCENQRAGYHLTGKTITYYPGDKIVITKVILWLGAAAVFFLPRVVIPLRQIDDETRRPSFFPEVGYNQYEGAYVKAKLGFGKDQYYYGYYRVEYFTKVGLGLGYVANYAKKDGRRSAQVNYYGIRDHRTQTSTHNITVNETENFSQTLRGNFVFGYQSAFGALVNLPPSTNINGTIAHSGARSQQNYSFSRTATGAQSSSTQFGLTDTRQLRSNVTQSENFTFSNSSTNYAGLAQSVSTAHFNMLTNATTPGATYTFKVDKQFTKTPYNFDTLPELLIRPNALMHPFGVPVQGVFTLGNYSERQNRFATTRADLNFTIGPALYTIFGSNLSMQGTLRQDIYGTGDLKAAITQNLSLNTPIGSHFVNSITYNEANYAGPAFIPFQNLDTQSNQNTKGAQDVLRFFNQDYYTLSINASTFFRPQAQPLTYQLSARPTARSIVILGGALNPGFGFSPTNVQFATPLGRDMTLQFAGNIDWKRQRSWLVNKSIFLSKIVGDCYEIRMQYNQDAKALNVTVDILAFPSHSAGFGIGGQNGSVIPSSFNF